MSIVSAGPQGRAPVGGLDSVLLPNLVLGAPAYFVAFLFAYGFEDSVGLAEHVTFLVLIAIVAMVSGVVGVALMTRVEPRLSASRRAAFCVPISLALNLAVLGAGSIVSATHKEENSVSAEFSTLTDVVLAVGLFGLAIVFAAAGLRANRR